MNETAPTGVWRFSIPGANRDAFLRAVALENRPTDNPDRLGGLSGECPRNAFTRCSIRMSPRFGMKYIRNGTLETADRHLVLRYPLVKQVIVYWLPFPHGLPTAPELMSKAASDWAGEHATVCRHIEAFDQSDMRKIHDVLSVNSHEILSAKSSIVRRVAARVDLGAIEEIADGTVRPELGSRRENADPTRRKVEPHQPRSTG